MSFGLCLTDLVWRPSAMGVIRLLFTFLHQTDACRWIRRWIPISIEDREIHTNISPNMGYDSCERLFTFSRFLLPEPDDTSYSWLDHNAFRRRALVSVGETH